MFENVFLEVWYVCVRSLKTFLFSSRPLKTFLSSLAGFDVGFSVLSKRFMDISSNLNVDCRHRVCFFPT